jgi:ABC-type sugar transport system substrate-binding protein
VYLYGIKGTALDTAEQEGFQSVVGGIPSIKVVASGQAGYTGTDEGRSAVQDILQTVPHPDVIVAAGDQGIEGAELALKAAGVTGVKLIGVGGSAPAIAGIKGGSWYGDVFGAPETEGRIAITALIKALRDGQDTGGVDTGTQLPDDGLVTNANVDQFTAQWTG